MEKELLGIFSSAARFAAPLEFPRTLLDWIQSYVVGLCLRGRRYNFSKINVDCWNESKESQIEAVDEWRISREHPIGPRAKTGL